MTPQEIQGEIALIHEEVNATMHGKVQQEDRYYLVSHTKALWEIALQLAKLREAIDIGVTVYQGSAVEVFEKAPAAAGCCARYRKTRTMHDLSCPTLR